MNDFFSTVLAWNFDTCIIFTRYLIPSTLRKVSHIEQKCHKIIFIRPQNYFSRVEEIRIWTSEASYRTPFINAFRFETVYTLKSCWLIARYVISWAGGPWHRCLSIADPFQMGHADSGTEARLVGARLACIAHALQSYIKPTTFDLDSVQARALFEERMHPHRLI
jgi:hypothetical protein